MKCSSVSPQLCVLFLLIALGLPMYSVADTAQDWMRRMVEARKQHNYEGVFVYGRGDDVNSVQIVHRFHQGEEQERLLHLDGERREILRQGDKVLCLLPGNETVELEQSLPSGPFPGSFTSSSPSLGDQYSLTLTGGGRVAGYDAVKLAVMAKDDFRYSYLLWLHEDTALLLKSLVLDKQGEVLERMQYTSLQIGGAIADEKLASHLQNAPDMKRETLSTPTITASMKHKWRPDWLPEGFKEAPFLIKPVKADHVNVDSQVFTDGLSAFSIFVEAAGKSAMPEGVSRMGATIAYAKAVGIGDESYVITVVGEVPLATAQRVADSMHPLEP